jgi:hypothetical protein
MVAVVTFSEVGGHAVNEDAYAVERHPGDPDCWLCCLADDDVVTMRGRSVGSPRWIA